MFDVSKTAAAAVKRTFGTKPMTLLVSGDGLIHNYESTVRVHGAIGDRGDIVCLSREARRFMELLQGGGVTVSVETSGETGTVVVDTGTGVARLEGEAMMPTDMGAPSFDAPVVTVPLSKAEWSALHASTSADNTVPIMQQVAVIEDSAGVLYVASTDRYRLTAIDVHDRAHVGDGLGANALVARHIVATAKALPVKTTATLTVGSEVNGRRVTGMTSAEFDVWSIEEEGDYPKIMSLFPKNARERFTVREAKNVGAAVKRMGSRIERNTPVRVTVEDGSVALSGGVESEYQERFTVDAEVLDTEDMWTGFNPLFLSQAFAMAGKGGVTVHQGEPRKPAVLTFDAAPSMRHLIMPIIRF